MMTDRRTLFSPQDDVEAAIVAALAATAGPVRVAMFSLTAPAIVKALVAAHGRGVDVALVLDLSQSSGASERRALAQLRTANVPFVLTTAPNGYAIMHHKFAVLGDTVIAGSYNWTVSARREANHLDSETDATRAAAFLAAWQALSDYAHAHPQPAPATTTVDSAGIETEW